MLHGLDAGGCLVVSSSNHRRWRESGVPVFIQRKAKGESTRSDNPCGLVVFHNNYRAMCNKACSWIKSITIWPLAKYGLVLYFVIFWILYFVQQFSPGCERHVLIARG